MSGHARRRDALRRALHDDDDLVLETLLVSSEPNVRYLSGFTGDSSMMLVGPGDRELIISDGRYTEQLERECPDLPKHIRPIGQKLSEAIGEIVSKLGISRLGIESAHLTLAAFEAIDVPLTTTQLVPTAGKVEQLRAVKDDEEQGVIRRAVAVAERALQHLLSGLRPDESEKDVADALEASLRRCGAEAASFDPIVAVGANAALPHYRPDAAARIGDGTFLLIDWGASVSGYKSDLTRVVPVSRVTSPFAEVYEAVRTAQDRAIAAIRPGVEAAAIDQVARQSLEQAGYGPQFLHSLGHGIGLQVHEAPSLRQPSEDRLEAGMVVTVEPGVYLPGWGGVRLELDVLVTDEGAEVLGQLSRDPDALAPFP